MLLDDQGFFAELRTAARNPDGVRVVVARYGAGWRVGLGVPTYGGLAAFPGARPSEWDVSAWLSSGNEPRHLKLEAAAEVALAFKADALDTPSLQGLGNRVTVVLDAEPAAAVVVV